NCGSLPVFRQNGNPTRCAIITATPSITLRFKARTETGAGRKAYSSMALNSLSHSFHCSEIDAITRSRFTSREMQPTTMNIVRRANPSFHTRPIRDNLERRLIRGAVYAFSALCRGRDGGIDGCLQRLDSDGFGQVGDKTHLLASGDVLFHAIAG